MVQVGSHEVNSTIRLLSNMWFLWVEASPGNHYGPNTKSLQIFQYLHSDPIQHAACPTNKPILLVLGLCHKDPQASSQLAPPQIATADRAATWKTKMRRTLALHIQIQKGCCLSGATSQAINKSINEWQKVYTWGQYAEQHREGLFSASVECLDRVPAGLPMRTEDVWPQQKHCNQPPHWPAPPLLPFL